MHLYLTPISTCLKFEAVLFVPVNYFKFDCKIMQTVLKQFCCPVNFLACACSQKNVYAIIGQSFLNILTGLGVCSKKSSLQKALNTLLLH